MLALANWMTAIAIGAVFVVLCFGIYSLFKGDEDRSTSNKLMRLRVVTQFVAVIVIMIAFYIKSNAG